MADLGNGTTIAFATSPFTAVITSLQVSGITRESIETTHLGTAAAGAGKFGSKTFIPAKNTDPGEIRLDPITIRGNQFLEPQSPGPARLGRAGGKQARRAGRRWAAVRMVPWGQGHH